MIADTTAMVSMLGVGCLVVGALVARLPVATCSECLHCRAAATRAATEQRRLREEYERREGIPPRRWGAPDDDDPDDRRP